MESTSAVVLAVAAVGCIDTSASSITVRLEQQAQNVRSLPVLASGKTSLLGQDVPDSHGEITMVARVSGADHVLLERFEFRVDVGGAPLDIEIERVRIDGADATTGLVRSSISDGDLVRVNFRAKQLAAIVQPEGEDYTAHTTLSWQEDDIGAVQSDEARLDVSNLIAAAVDTGSFVLRTDRAREAHAPATGSTAARMRASVEITSGLTVNLQDVRMRTTYLGAGTVPALGLALVDSPATQIDGTAASQVAPGQILDVYTSSQPGAAGAPYTAAGTAATTGSVAGGKAIVTIELDYQPSDGTGSLGTDVLAFVADVP